ncbi:hypothetical protein [Actinopolyspora saharensis]|uniref:hypothetical protein n=1 Tax=Actinopolyspora saharensis TaxID=995062 RepID=UPI001113B1DB|nr:hypothetical protein [Actinopolyspora saharensis]
MDEDFVRPFDERGVTVGGDFEVAEPELHHDESYLGLVRDLAAASMNVVQGRGATVCAVLRGGPEEFWVGLAPHNQLAHRYALRISRVDGAGRTRRYHDVLWLLRDGESRRGHDRSWFEGLPVVGWLHGAPVRDSGDFPELPRLEMVQDSLRTTLLSLAGEPAPLPAEHAPRLAGFSWFDSESVRVYVTTPAEGAVLGVDLDLPAGTEVGPPVGTAAIPDLMRRLADGVPVEWRSREHRAPDEFCDRLFDLRRDTTEPTRSS